MTRISEEILVKDEVENKAVKAKTKKGMEKGKWRTRKPRGQGKDNGMSGMRTT